MKIYLAILFSLFLSAAYAQSPEYITYDQLEAKINKQDDTLRIINFWATWCKPCVEEIPAFQKITTEYKGKKVKVLLVSLDFKSKIETSLVPFIQKNKVTAEVVVIDQNNANEWIGKVSKYWSGSIPATLFIFPGGQRAFHEGSLTYDDLKAKIEANIKP